MPGLDAEWTLEEMSERYLRGRSVVLTRAFCAVGSKYGLDPQETHCEFYMFVRSRRDDEDEASTCSEKGWGARVFAWSKRPETRSRFFTLLGAKRSAAAWRDRGKFESIRDATRDLDASAYTRFSVTAGVDFHGLRVAPSNAWAIVWDAVARALDAGAVSPQDQRNLEAFVMHLEGRSNADVAAHLAVREASLRTYRSRAAAYIRDLLGTTDAAEL